MKSRRIITYIIGILAAIILTLVLIQIFMAPPAGDLLSLAALLGVTGLVSAVVGFISHRLGWWRKFRSLAQALALSYLLASGLTLFNVWLTARLMFSDQHDLALATLLLVFASVISVSFGFFISNSVTDALKDLVRGSRELSHGDFTTRVTTEGRDEIARLAESFNEMVTRLEEADQAEKALEEARRNLVAWASHDLRTPLSTLRVMVDALAEGVVEDPETINRYLQQSQQEIERLSKMIDDLFELAMIDAGGIELQGEPASLSDLISDTIEGFQIKARHHGLTLSGEVGQGVDPIWMASEKISRVLLNLVENAIRHTPSGGKIDLGATLANGNVQITVRDTGEGIAKHDLPQVFDRFYRGEESRSRKGYPTGGTGLGLAISKGIIEAHGGKIWAVSEHGAGTNIHFTLPKERPGELSS